MFYGRIGGAGAKWAVIVIICIVKVKHCWCKTYSIGLGPHLFVKVTRPGDSEVTIAVFESSCHLLLPV